METVQAALSPYPNETVQVSLTPLRRTLASSP